MLAAGDRSMDKNKIRNDHYFYGLESTGEDRNCADNCAIM